MFILPKYSEPDFSQLKGCPNAKFVPCPKDGVAPENFHAMSIYPEYFNVDGEWLLAEESRMDCVPVLEGGKILIKEFRNLKEGELVAVGRTEDGSDGIFLHEKAFVQAEESEQAFAFRQNRSRETAFSKDYDELYELLEHEKEHGKILWVMGPACAFDHDTRDSLSKLIKAGYMQALLTGNALATHDLEAGLFGTALGQNVYTQESVINGHYCHLDLINKAREAGSIENLINKYNIKDGIIKTCIEENVPIVLAGSIRDDGPLPPVYADVYEAQDAMRHEVRDATTIIALATTLHTIAVGNMTPSYRKRDGVLRPVYFYSVDVSEFPLNKLRDRGSLSSRTIVANVQDFVTQIAKRLVP
ncbi:MAG: hypothetical protein Q4E07_00020 [Eubacteriales bacterium]|nr:hypothetical protein [Eubacteriales bacterium]